MFKDIIKYTDYNGIQREETFYFNLSRAELIEMELSTQAGVEEKIRLLIATKDNAQIMHTFKDLLLKSYGIKSEDGTRFIKSQQLRDEFEQSEAYSELLVKLLSDEQYQIKFINNLINGSNVPEVNEEDAIAKLKELGYDTSRIEAAMKNDNKVVPMKEENVENNKNS